MRNSFILTAVSFVLLGSTAGVSGEGGYRVVVKIADVTATSADSLIRVPVHISFPKDTLAGVEMYFTIDENRNIQFASDDVRPDGLSMAADTAGTIMSGWEWVDVNTLENTTFDLKMAGLADWPDQEMTAPVPPRDSALLTTLYFRLDDTYPLTPGTRFEVRINSQKSGFSDPTGNSIGVVTTHEKVCKEYVGDSCARWQVARVGVLDTTVVSFKNGSITIAGDETPGH